MRAASVVTGPHLAVAVAFAFAAASAPSPAAADSLQATRYEVIERSHVVDVKVERGFATLVVQRTVANAGPKSDQATFMLDIPSTAVATRLRTAGVNAKGQTVWFEGELMEAEAAAKKYEELTGIGGYYPKDPALLSWRHQGLLALQVFPVPAQSNKTVEYTLKMPLTYEDGAYRLELPQMGTEALDATVRVAAARPQDSLRVNGVLPAIGAGGAVIARADKPLTIELRPRGAKPVESTLASVAISDDRHLVRAVIAAAPHVAEAPQNAHVVVLFDGSRSHHTAQAGLAAVRAYLGHMKGATVDFLVFDREVRAPLGRSLPVASAVAKLAAFELEPRNGSRIDDALARADAILLASPAQARRVVLVTDTLTRSELTAEQLGASAWRSGAVVHVATVGNGAASLARDDASPWATLPRRTGGLFWAATSTEQIDGATRTTFEEWARPKRIDKLAVTGFDETFAAPAALDEGQGLQHFAVTTKGTARVEIRGELWSRPIESSVTPSAENAKLAAALAFGSDVWSELTESEQMRLAMLGGAVSPVTSYLAIEPGVRPSNEGLDWSTIGHGGGTGTGSGFGSGSGRLFGSRTGPVVDKGAWLRAQLRMALSRCAPPGSAVTVSLESTLDEVVDVKRVELAPSRDAKVETCLREEVWGLALPATSFKETFEAHTVEVKP